MDVDTAIIAGAVAGGITGGIIAAIVTLGLIRRDRRVTEHNRTGEHPSREWRVGSGPLTRRYTHQTVPGAETDELQRPDAERQASQPGQDPGDRPGGSGAG
ncbi:MAG TPA: hypothetical protein VGR87_11265 [Candidatus Limnocylindria bacterium]|jgi:hypothetical protein|nr:hypothetical protein [Candidatus Limnocylindria bacterium]